MEPASIGPVVASEPPDGSLAARRLCQLVPEFLFDRGAALGRLESAETLVSGTRPRPTGKEVSQPATGPREHQSDLINSRPLAAKDLGDDRTGNVSLLRETRAARARRLREVRQRRSKAIDAETFSPNDRSEDVAQRSLQRVERRRSPSIQLRPAVRTCPEELVELQR